MIFDQQNLPVCLNEFFQVIPVHISVDILAWPVDCVCCAAFSSPGLVVHIIYVIVSTVTRVQALTDTYNNISNRGTEEKERAHVYNPAAGWMLRTRSSGIKSRMENIQI